MEFDEAIRHFNSMYKLPNEGMPTLKAVGDPRQRILSFAKTLRDEIDEGAEIIDKINAGASELDVLTDLADWLGDIQVYCASEMAKYGIPLDLTLNIIMQSNFSKLGADGKPIYNADGKVLKGGNYYRPEPKIREMLANYRKKP